MQLKHLIAARAFAREPCAPSPLTPPEQFIMTSSNLFSRRTFLGVALGTLPAAALPGGAFAQLWPKSEFDRKVDDPWVLALNDGSLWDPAMDGPIRVPTLRSVLDDQFPGIATAQGSELDALLMPYMIDSLGLDEEDSEEWKAGLAELRAALDFGLDTSDSEFVEWCDRDSNQAAWTTWKELPEGIQEGFEVYLVESDRPGSNLTYISYDGKLEDLNRNLVAAGLNIVVIRQEPNWELLFPGDPGYDD